MEVYPFSWMSFLIIGLGTMLLVGESLVKARGILSLLVLTFISLYFYAYSDPSMFFIIAILYSLGVILIFVNGTLYSAISNSYWIEKQTDIIVKEVDGTRILVNLLDKDSQ